MGIVVQCYGCTKPEHPRVGVHILRLRVDVLPLALEVSLSRLVQIQVLSVHEDPTGGVLGLAFLAESNPLNLVVTPQLDGPGYNPPCQGVAARSQYSVSSRLGHLNMASVGCPPRNLPSRPSSLGPPFDDAGLG